MTVRHIVDLFWIISLPPVDFKHWMNTGLSSVALPSGSTLALA